MATRFGTKLRHCPPILAGACQSLPLATSTSATFFCQTSYVPGPLRIVRRKHSGNGSRRLSRRVVLGLGASFWSQWMDMAGIPGNKAFLASARQKDVIEEIKGSVRSNGLELASRDICLLSADLLFRDTESGNLYSDCSGPEMLILVQVLKNVDWPEEFPFKEQDFQRFDKSPDSYFYDTPRFVTHIDDPAIAALTRYYSEVLPPSNTPGAAVLDMCSSWVSHYPKGYKQDRIVGMGMNYEELKRNPVLTECIVQDLNVNPKLPFEDSTFDVITNVVSVDYLTKPIEVFKEMSRILKPGGPAIISFSNRCFWTKAISIWTSTGDADHVMIVGSYFHYGGGFEPPQAVDISPNPGRSDPMYVVYSRKLATA